jgi:hypothetical protein
MLDQTTTTKIKEKLWQKVTLAGIHKNYLQTSYDHHFDRGCLIRGAMSAFLGHPFVNRAPLP